MPINADPHQALRDQYASAILVRVALRRALHEAVESERASHEALCAAAGEAAVDAVRQQYLSTPHLEVAHV